MGAPERRPAAPALILASRSPQRRAILRQLGIPFVVREVDVVERSEGDGAEVASENARRKALAGVRGGTGADPRVLGVDTVVLCDGAIYGKPPDEDAARALLRRLSGRSHEVVSGIAVAEPGGLRVATVTTSVAFRTLDEATVEWYLGSGEWRGRAGGYAIQARGAALVKAVRGDYYNVVGLPVATLLDVCPDLLGPHGDG